ncbi:phospholipase [Aquipuribacter nitratireducens]|uniref:Phospholipase n=1 Tax=Aquipuribacter nitratireducens TaxID=650104 RepID=A0ABW0GLH8_9MICO
MTRHTTGHRASLRPLRRVLATTGATLAVVALGVGASAVATSPTLAGADDRVALGTLLGEEPGAAGAEAALAEREQEQASRSQRAPLPAGLPSTSSQAQAWAEADAAAQQLLQERQDVADAERERKAAEAARQAAEEEAARQAAEEAARVAAEEEAARKAAEEEAARQAAEEEAARKAAEEEAARAAAAAAATPGSNRALGQQLLAEAGFGAGQWSCLDALWQKESNWSHTADNPTSSAYGIPQALPGSKMASAGSDWETNPATQIRWGLGYIADRYGTPCAAWEHSQAHNWY